jgi:putative RecB family exonuclease
VTNTLDGKPITFEVGQDGAAVIATMKISGRKVLRFDAVEYGRPFVEALQDQRLNNVHVWGQHTDGRTLKIARTTRRQNGVVILAGAGMTVRRIAHVTEEASHALAADFIEAGAGLIAIANDAQYDVMPTVAELLADMRASEDHTDEVFEDIATSGRPAVTYEDREDILLVLTFDLVRDIDHTPDRQDWRSVSQIKEYSDCGYAYYLRRVLKLGTEWPSWWYVGGRAFARFKEWYENEASIAVLFPTPDQSALEFQLILTECIAREEELTGVARAEWKAAKSGTENEAWWFEHGAGMARLYANRNPQQRPFKTLRMPDGTLALELEFRADFDGVGVRGFIDHVTIDREGYVDVIDDKSGANPPTDRFQLDVYASALEKAYDLVPARVAYANAREQKKGSHLTTYAWDGSRRLPTTERIQRMDRAERDRVYLPVVGKQCSYCNVRKSCMFGGTGEEIL